MKLATFYVQIYAKTFTLSQSTLKIKAMSLGHFFEILLMSAGICKQHFYIKAKLCNIFKTANTKTLIKGIIESPFKLLKTH